MLCDELVTIWPERWPRPDADNTRHNARQVASFGRDFAGREPGDIDVLEARSWALANPGQARYVRTMFNDLLDARLVEQNVFAGIRIPIGTEEVVVPSLEEVEALVAGAMAGGDIALASRITFAAETGVRFGEQRAIVRPDTAKAGNVFYDDRRRLQIDWQINRAGKLKKPKTKRSVGPIMVSKTARTAVELALSVQVSKRRTKTGYVWLGDPRELEEGWSELRRGVGVWFKWHALRHYAATQLLDRGATVDDVARQLRCTTNEIRRTYGHPNAEKALGRLESFTDA